jgi:hypothetical protein
MAKRQATSKGGGVMVELSRLKKRMAVIAADGYRVGFVSRMAGPDRIRITSLSGSHGFDHIIPLAWVSAVDKYVYLNRTRRFVAGNWEPAPALPVRLTELPKPVGFSASIEAAAAVGKARIRPEAA